MLVNFVLEGRFKREDEGITLEELYNKKITVMMKNIN